MLYRLSCGMSRVQVWEKEPIRGLSERLQRPWRESRDMTSWSCGGVSRGAGVLGWSRGMSRDRSLGHVGCHMCRSTSGGQSEGLQRAFRYPGGSHVI